MSVGLQRGTVKLEPHQLQWEQSARDTILQLKALLPDIIMDAQHIGSTSVPAVWAKPIIDIVIGVRDFQALTEMNPLLEKHGFIYRGQDQPEQHLYVCGTDIVRTHHIHAVIWKHEAWNNYISFRDYLNAHPQSAEEYCKLKKSLAEQYANSRERYTALKSEFIHQILTAASEWQTGRNMQNDVHASE